MRGSEARVELGVRLGKRWRCLMMDESKAAEQEGDRREGMKKRYPKMG